MHQESVSVKRLKPNNGQIPGLPKNPRKISSYAKDALRKSLQESPEMLEFRSLVVFPFDGDLVVIIGNQRLGICKDMKFKELPCFILDSDTPVEKLKEYSVKDNFNAGQFDWQLLKEEWGVDALANWGLWEKEPIEEGKEEVKFDAATPKPIIITVEFESQAQREVLYSKLQGEGFNCWYGKKKPKD